MANHVADLAFGQTWAKQYYNTKFKYQPISTAKRIPRSKEELCDPAVGDRVISSEPGDLQVKQRVMESELRIIQEKIASCTEVLSGPWEVLGGKEARSNLESLRAKMAELKRSIDRIRSEQGVGTIVPTRGKPISPDGAISVKWDDGKVCLYYRCKEGARYPLCRVLKNSDTKRTSSSLKNSMNLGKDRHTYTLILGLNAMAMPGEAGRLAAAARRKALLRKFILRLQRSSLSKVFQKWRRYRQPRNFCLITLKPLGLDCEDSGNIFFHPAITEILNARPRKKPTEHWQRVLVENSTNAEWFQSKLVRCAHIISALSGAGFTALNSPSSKPPYPPFLSLICS